MTRLEEQIRVKAEEQRRAGQSLDSTCQICLKTKFADGVGHLCNYCNVRCCARCGGKVALRSSKVSDFAIPDFLPYFVFTPAFCLITMG